MMPGRAGPPSTQTPAWLAALLIPFVLAGLSTVAADVRLIDAIERAELVVVGTPTVLEASMVPSGRLGQDARSRVSAFLRKIAAEVVAFNEQHLEAATAALLRFGRGRHPATLNSGDCMSHAVASVAGMPILFTGENFARTDVPRS